MPADTRLRNIVISIFAVLWIFVFHYESICYFYLDPHFKNPLPKVKFLFPPAGWIMFFNVGDSYGNVEVYGIKGESIQIIDPHDIFRTRTVGFDNIHRGILGEVADINRAKDFCAFLRRRFPYYDRFAVTAVYYPSVTKNPYERYQQVRYQCEAR